MVIAFLIKKIQQKVLFVALAVWASIFKVIESLKTGDHPLTIAINGPITLVLAATLYI